MQVRERADLSPGQIIGRLTAIAPKTVRGRARTPALVRNHARLAVDGPVHDGQPFVLDLTGRVLAGRGHRAGLLTTIVPF